MIYPALRLGYLALPEVLVEPITAARWLSGWMSPSFEQEVVASFMEDGGFERHLRRTRVRCAARRRALLSALEEHLPGRFEVSGADAGLHVTAWLRGRNRSVRRLTAQAREAGVGVYPVNPCYAGRARPGIILGYGTLEPDEIRRGVLRLAAAVDG